MLYTVKTSVLSLPGGKAVYAAGHPGMPSDGIVSTRQLEGTDIQALLDMGAIAVLEEEHPGEIALGSMSKAELVQFAADNGLELEPKKMNRDAMIKTIVEAQVPLVPEETDQGESDPTVDGEAGNSRVVASATEG